TYGLPSVGPTDLPPVVPQGAEVLLSTRFPYLSVAQRRDVLATTELPSGVPLDDGSGWARLNLYAAADGYGAFDNPVTVAMNAALTNNGTVSPGDPTGTLSVGGAFAQERSGTFQTQLEGASAGALQVSGTATLNGALRVMPLNGFVPSFGQTFSILTAGD